MSKKTFKLIIETPNQSVSIDTDTQSLSFKATDGDMQIFAHHLSLMTTIDYSRLTVTKADKTQDTYLCRNAIVHFDNVGNQARILAQYCQLESETSIESIKDYLKYISDHLSNHQALNDIQLVYLNNEKIAVEKMLADK